MSLCALLLLIFSLTTPSWAADVEAFSDVDINDPASLREASRVLEEELRLAARPQTYLLIDLASQSVFIKARGVVLHRIPIESWSVISNDLMTGTFRLLARPAVVRRKIDPAATVEQEPISLADMPIYYQLAYTPELTIEIMPTATDHPFQWTLTSSQILWRQLKNWGSALFSENTNAQQPYLQLTLSAEHAQSLAWSLVDGMSLVIRRSTDR